MELETMLHIIAIIYFVTMFVLSSIDAQNRTVYRGLQVLIIIIDIIGLINEFAIFAIRIRRHENVILTVFLIVVWAYLALTTIDYLRKH